MPIPGDPGYYAQDNAPYLRYWDGAIYDPFFAANAVQTVGTNASVTRRAQAVVTKTTSPCYGYNFVVSRDGVGNPIEVYSGLYGSTNVTTIDVNAEFATAVAGSIVTMCYDENKDNIYFTWADGGAATVRVSVIDCSVTPPVINTDIYGSGETYLESETNADYPTPGVYLFLGGNCDMIYNPVNNRKYILTTTGRYYIINSNDKFDIVALGEKATCTLAAAASPESDGMCIVTASPPAAPFDARMLCLYGNNMDLTYEIAGHKVDPNGDVWLVSDDVSATTNSLMCLDGTKTLADGAALIKYAVNVPAIAGGFYPTPGAILPTFSPFAIFPGDGTINPFLVLICENGITSKPIAFTLAGALIGDFITSISSYLASDITSIWWSTVLNCFVVTRTSGQEAIMIDVAGAEISAIDYTPINPALPDISSLIDDPINGQLIATDEANADNLFYLFDYDSTISCGGGGIVEMYIGADGPYTFDSATMSWVPIAATVTHIPTTPIVSQFTVTATLDPTLITLGALLYSTDFGFTWTTATDISGTVYANPAAWLTGRVYNNIASLTNIKVSFTTTANCGLESANITI